MVAARLEGSRRVVLRAEQRIRDLEIMLKLSQEHGQTVVDKLNQVELKQRMQRKKNDSLEQERISIMKDAKGVLEEEVVESEDDDDEDDDDDDSMEENTEEVEQSIEEQEEEEVEQQEQQEQHSNSRTTTMNQRRPSVQDRIANLEHKERSEASESSLLGTGVRRISINAGKWKKDILPVLLAHTPTTEQTPSREQTQVAQTPHENPAKTDRHASPLGPLSPLSPLGPSSPLSPDQGSPRCTSAELLAMDSDHGSLMAVVQHFTLRDRIATMLSSADCCRWMKLSSKKYLPLLNNNVLLTHTIRRECRYTGLSAQRRGLVWMWPAVTNDVAVYQEYITKYKVQLSNKNEPQEWFHDLNKDINYLTDSYGNNDQILLTSMSVKTILSCYVAYDNEVGYCQGKWPTQVEMNN